MADPIVVVDSSEIRQGKLEQLEVAIRELAEFVEANEAAPLAYNVYFDEEGTRMTIVQVHPSSASLEQHLQVAGPMFRKLADLLVLARVDFYGQPSEIVLEQMRQKARMLGNAEVVVNERVAGFIRLGRPAT
jgi:quinol monooxygenase YgiN